MKRFLGFTLAEVEKQVNSPIKDWNYINSPNFDPCREFKYYTETLYRTPNGEYILHTMWRISDLWAEDAVRNGEMTEDELEPHEEYEIISEEQAQKWLKEKAQPEKEIKNTFTKSKENLNKKKSFYDNHHRASNQYVSEYLTHLESFRKIDIDDIDIVATKICENMIKEAINSGEMTVSGLRASLESIHATEVEIYQYSDNEYEISLKANYDPEDGDILTVPFTTYMTVVIAADNSFRFLYGTSAFKLTIDNKELWCDPSSLYYYYCNHPEEFNKNDFLNFTEVNKE